MRTSSRMDRSPSLNGWRNITACWLSNLKPHFQRIPGRSGCYDGRTLSVCTLHCYQLQCEQGKKSKTDAGGRAGDDPRWKTFCFSMQNPKANRPERSESEGPANRDKGSAQQPSIASGENCRQTHCDFHWKPRDF